MTGPSICLLGGFEVRLAGGTIAALPTRKAEALLAIITLAGGATVSRERLAELLWGDRGEAQARHSLSQALTSIRTALGGEDWLLATRDGVTFALGRVAVDALDFQSRAAAEDFDSLNEAARLYQGPLVDGMALREEGFNEWLLTERRRLHNIALSGLLRLGQAARARRDSVTARTALERAVALEPLSEEANRDLIRLHLDEGRAADAARQYAACADLLRRELQVEPGPELAALRREALAPQPAPPIATDGVEGERKQITAFAASLAMGHGMTPDLEDLEPLLEAAARRVAEAVRAHGGQVLRCSAEGVSAAFGAPVAFEDHAVRACRAALAALMAAQEGDRAIVLAIGLDSAEVLLRSGALSGPALQRAARLAASALPGTALVTEASMVLTRGKMRFTETEQQLSDSGLPGPALYRLEAPTEGAAQTTAAGFVERQGELDALATALAPTSVGSGRIVAIVGEAGVGKSRLAREFLSGRLPPDWRAIAFAADSQSGDVAYAAVAGLIRAYFGIAQGEDAKIARARVVSTGNTLALAPAVMEALLALLGDSVATSDVESPWDKLEPAQRGRRLVEAVKALLHRHAADQPLLALLEDLHWIDAASRDVLESVIETLPASRLALLVNYRPEFAHAWASLGHYRQIRLEPITQDGARALLDRALGTDATLEPLKQQLTARAGGNPFFLEECARAAEASGLLRGEPGAYRLDGNPDRLVLPATVQAVIAARLDRLALDDKRLLQMAAVIGAEGPGPLLRAVSDLSDEAFGRAMARLHTGEFLLPLRVVPEPVHRFKHALTHEVVYGSLLRQDRRELHLRVLRAMERSQGTKAAQRATESPVEMLAFHAARAEDWEAAADYGRKAGLRAAARSANREAIGHYSRALDALRRLPDGPDRAAAEADLNIEIRNALFIIGEHDAIPSRLEEAARIAEGVGDKPRQMRAGLLLSGWYWQSAQHRLAAAAADSAMAIASTGEGDLTTALGLYRRGTILQAVGAYREAVTVLREAIALLDRRGEQDAFAFGGYPFVFCHSFLAWSLAELGEDAAARDEGARGWAAAAQLGNSYSQAVMSFGHGHALIRAGTLEEAEAVLERGLELYRVVEVPATYPWIAAGLGYVRVMRGDTERGLALLRQAVMPEVRARGPMYAHTYLRLAEATHHLGLTGEALAAARAGREAAEAQEERGHLAWAGRVLGDVLSAEAPREAGSHYRQAADIAEELGMRPEVELVAAGLAKIKGRARRMG